MKTIKIDDNTYEKIKDLLTPDEKVDISTLEDFVNHNVFIRTITYFFVGKLVKITGNFLELEDASWVADTGRFMNCIKNGEINEVEPVGRTFVNSQTIVDLYLWQHDLPTEQK